MITEGSNDVAKNVRVSLAGHFDLAVHPKWYSIILGEGFGTASLTCR